MQLDPLRTADQAKRNTSNMPTSPARPDTEPQAARLRAAPGSLQCRRLPVHEIGPCLHQAPPGGVVLAAVVGGFDAVGFLVHETRLDDLLARAGRFIGLGCKARPAQPVGARPLGHTEAPQHHQQRHRVHRLVHGRRRENVNAVLAPLLFQNLDRQIGQVHDVWLPPLHPFRRERSDAPCQVDLGPPRPQDLAGARGGEQAELQCSRARALGRAQSPDEFRDLPVIERAVLLVFPAALAFGQFAADLNLRHLADRKIRVPRAIRASSLRECITSHGAGGGSGERRGLPAVRAQRRRRQFAEQLAVFGAETAEMPEAPTRNDILDLEQPVRASVKKVLPGSVQS
jgi:hypothetical protein